MRSIPRPQRRAVALISGGLDSMLAARVVQEQGIHVEGVNFFTGFCVEGHTHSIRDRKHEKPKRNNALWVAEQLGIKLHIIDISEDYKDVVLHPRHGYGQNLNPCLDCKIFMVGKTLELGLIDDLDFDFVLTGEVIGQRPKSQRRETMPIIAKESGANDRLLRPLCALNLPPTLPEREGWVNRNQLFGFHGRSRKPQMELAEKFGFSDYAQPAGGCCFLTDETYSNKLRDLWQARNSRDSQLDDIVLLKIGRHIRPRPHFKLIIGREEGENRFLAGYRNQFTHLAVTDYPGPLALIDGNPTTTDIELAARIVARYSQGKAVDKLLVTVASATGLTRDIEVTPMAPHELEPSWHVGS